jgi:hypothetical protein
MEIKLGTVIFAIIALFLFKISYENDFWKQESAQSNKRTAHPVHTVSTNFGSH